PDTEIFYWVGEGAPQGNKGTHSKQWMEIWNNVFMQYNRLNETTLEKLPAPCVDTGMGLERTIVTLNGLKHVYETDAFADILTAIKEKVGGENYTERSARIVADHLRAAVHMLADGVVPKNVDQGYILRRLIRRAIRELYKMQFEQPTITAIAKLFIKKFESVYESVQVNQTTILEELEKEEGKFRQTLSKGLKEFERRCQEGTLTGKDAFDLFSTYGFPLEMTQELAQEKHLTIDTAAFQAEFKKHQDLSRTAAAGKFKGGLGGDSPKITAFHTATHLMLAALRQELGAGVHQAGSNITEERTRFDFTYPEKVSREVLDRVENSVNEAIAAKAAVTITVIPKEEAKAKGVEGSFWEKYPAQVNVYQVASGEKVYSQELCGGPHVTNTSEIGLFGKFKIIKEEASSAGVRRIKAVLEK
ncbi:MAG: alanine--tRNA ligase, partial [Candidatus Moraniibacteriota bacterium]